jgi:hypothetical protein
LLLLLVLLQMRQHSSRCSFFHFTAVRPLRSRRVIRCTRFRQLARICSTSI